jgi:hypothetical protein
MNRPIVEKNLVSLIRRSYKRIVNVFDDYLQYCDGCMIVNLDYENFKAIQELFNTKALTDLRKFIPSETYDLKSVIKTDGEVIACATNFIQEDVYAGDAGRIFKIENNYYLFKKKYVDVFKDVDYRAVPYSNNLYMLNVYFMDNLIGVIMPLRDTYGQQNTKKLVESIEGVEHE